MMCRAQRRVVPGGVPRPHFAIEGSPASSRFGAKRIEVQETGVLIFFGRRIAGLDFRVLSRPGVEFLDSRDHYRLLCFREVVVER
jgi:hypothetical protein